MILTEEMIKELPLLTKEEEDNLYVIGEFKKVVLAEINEDFDEIDALFEKDATNNTDMEKKHNLSKEYLDSLTEEQRINEMSEWSAEEWGNYYCPEGTISSEVYYLLVIDNLTAQKTPK